MRVIIAPDSFKGSVSAAEAAEAIAAGVKRAYPEAETVNIPVADGGEGTMDSLVAATGGRKAAVTVTGPLGTKVTAEYGWLGDDATCVIEMASASGLCLVPPERLDPLAATTYGTGELIRHALAAGCRRFILAIGGSATNDGGAGVLQALGMGLLDSDGTLVASGAGGGVLDRIAAIDDTGFDPRIAQSTFLTASDVQNPLIGPTGASYVFGPQKGASPHIAAVLDEHMRHWSDIVETHTGVRLHDMPGAGAAGGLGGAFLAFFPSTMRRGIEIVIEYTGLREALSRGAAAVFTGEGRIDAQTAHGKAPLGVAQQAKRHGIPTFVLAGSIGPGIESLYGHGIASIHSIVNGPMTIEAAIANAPELLTLAAEQVTRTWLAGLRNFPSCSASN